ncbi:hypothetical protein RI367_006474 [Sorochytrium milnesiophthora]
MTSTRCPPTFMGVVYQPGTCYPTKKKLGPGVVLFNNTTQTPATIDRSGFAVLDEGGEYTAERVDSERMRKWLQMPEAERRRLQQQQQQLSGRGVSPSKSSSYMYGKFRRSSNTIAKSLGVFTSMLSTIDGDGGEAGGGEGGSSSPGSSPEKTSLFSSIRRRRASEQQQSGSTPGIGSPGGSNSSNNHRGSLKGLINIGHKSQSSTDVRGRRLSMSGKTDSHVSMNGLDGGAEGTSSGSPTASPGKPKKSVVSGLQKEETDTMSNSSSDEELSLEDFFKRDRSKVKATSMMNVSGVAGSPDVPGTNAPSLASAKTASSAVTSVEAMTTNEEQRSTLNPDRSVSLSVIIPDNDTKPLSAHGSSPGIHKQLSPLLPPHIADSTRKASESSLVGSIAEIVTEMTAMSGMLKYQKTPESAYYEPVYVVLADFYLELYTSETAKEPFVSLTMTENCLALSADKHDGLNTFHVVQNDESFCLLAESKDSMLAWMGAINSASLKIYLAQFLTSEDAPKFTQSGHLIEEVTYSTVTDYKQELESLLKSFNYVALSRLASPTKSPTGAPAATVAAPVSPGAQADSSTPSSPKLGVPVSREQARAVMRRNSSMDGHKAKAWASSALCSPAPQTDETDTIDSQAATATTTSLSSQGLPQSPTVAIYSVEPSSPTTPLPGATFSAQLSDADISPLSSPERLSDSLATPSVSVNNASSESVHSAGGSTAAAAAAAGLLSANNDSVGVHSEFKPERIEEELVNDRESVASANVDVIQEQLQRLQMAVDKSSDSRNGMTAADSSSIPGHGTSSGGTDTRHSIMIKQLSMEMTEGVTIQYEKRDGVVDKHAIVAATLDRLIERLSNEYGPDPNYIDSFLLTHRHFTTSDVVLDKFIAQVHCVPPESPTEAQVTYVRQWRPVVRVRLAAIVKYWVEQYWVDFKDVNGTAYQALGRFIDALEQLEQDSVDQPPFDEHKQDLLKVARLLRKHVNYQELRYKPPAKAQRFERPKDTPVDVRNLDAAQMAHQLTLLEFERLAAVRPFEFTMQLWCNVKDPAVECELLPLTEMASSFNQMSYWVATEICTQPELKARCKVVEKMIKIAKECRRERNYNSLMAIISGLSQSSVIRLKQTWENVQEKYRQTLRELEELVSPQHNYRNYRQIYEQLEREPNPPPFVPFFALFLKDLQFINDGNPKMLSNGLVNFGKARMLADKVHMLRSWQQLRSTSVNSRNSAAGTSAGQGAAMVIDPQVTAYCRSLRYLKESSLYRYSCLCESKSNDGGSVRLVDKWAKEAAGTGKGLW